MPVNVLVVSNVPFSESNNMGKTLSGLFQSWKKENLAQLYFNEQTPHSGICDNYFCFSDKDAVKAVFNRKHRGTIFKSSVYQKDSDDMSSSKVYAHGKPMRKYFLLLRDLVWKFSAWKSNELIQWVKDFSPDIIFLASGDNVFPFRIVDYLVHAERIPVVTVCYDDYFLRSVKSEGFANRIQRNNLLRWAHSMLDNAECLFTTCTEMSDAYASLFKAHCVELYCTFDNLHFSTLRTEKICYFGNLSLGRWKALCEIGRILFSNGFGGIHVFSSEKDLSIINEIKKSPGVFFHGSISDKDVADQIPQCHTLVHVESFDACSRERVKFSISTKLANYLVSGVPILAYGPTDVASIRYLMRHSAACVVTNPSELQQNIFRVMNDTEFCSEIVKNARELAFKNHSRVRNSTLLETKLTEIAMENRINE